MTQILIPLVEMLQLMRGTNPLEGFFIASKLGEFFLRLGPDLASVTILAQDVTYCHTFGHFWVFGNGRFRPFEISKSSQENLAAGQK